MTNLEKIASKVFKGTATPEECGAIASIRGCSYTAESGRVYAVEMLLTLRAWRWVRQNAVKVTDERFKELLPELEHLV